MSLFHTVSSLLIRRAKVTDPDFIIGGLDNPYLRRWHVIPRNPIFNIYLHQILRSDDDRALHCHPWCNMSVILRGEYIERVPLRQSQVTGFDYVEGHTRDLLRLEGDVTARFGRWRHRLIIPEMSQGCWSLFMTGPVYRRWGFWCRTRWIYWREFVDARDKGLTGRGCGE